MKLTPTGPGLLWGIPTLGRLQPIQWGLAFKAINPPINFNVNTTIVWGEKVAIAREKIAEQAIQLGSKYLFFLGDDVVPPAHTLRQLIFRMDQDEKLGVVGGVYCSKINPSAPLVFRENGRGSYWDWKVGEYFEITGIGMDCTLIRVDVLKKMSKPWFQTIDSDSFLEGTNHAESWTEDLYFCNKLLKETDYKVFCDSMIICDHYDGNTAYNLPKGSKPLQKVGFEETKKKMLDIGCGPINRSEQFPEHNLIRFDINEEWNPDYRGDARQLPFAEGEFDLVFSSHVLEHFQRKEWEGVLKEWIRVLKHDGTLMLALPNIEWAAKQLLADKMEEGATMNDVLNVFHGGQSNEYDIHYNGFYPKRIQDFLETEGFKDITFEHQHYNMCVKAIKG